MPIFRAAYTGDFLDERGHSAYGDIRLPAIDAVAARDSVGKLWLALVNVDPNRSAKIAVSLEGASVRSAAGELLTATTVDARNTFEHSRTIMPRPFAGTVSLNQLEFDLPPKSIAVVEVRSQSGAVQTRRP